MPRRLTLLLMLFVVSGCGSAAFRDSQDWSAVTDPRLFRTCQVTDWGSGVWLAHGEEGSYVLTCAHLVKDAKQADVHVMNPQTRRYEHFRGEVVLTSDSQREDLALLRLDRAPSFAAPFKTQLASPVSRTDPQAVDIMNASLGAEKRPFTRTASIVALTLRRSDTSDWMQKGLFQAGLKDALGSANSGSPVFSGSRLVGLIESALGDATLSIGMCSSLPEPIETFLREGGYLARCVSTE